MTGPDAAGQVTVIDETPAVAAGVPGAGCTVRAGRTVAENASGPVPAALTATTCSE